MLTGGATYYILLALAVVVVLFAIVAFVHAARMRADAFVAADKLTKPIWLLILGLAAVLNATVLLFGGGAGALLALAGLVGTIVYWVDVKPRLEQVTRPRGW